MILNDVLNTEHGIQVFDLFFEPVITDTGVNQLTRERENEEDISHSWK